MTYDEAATVIARHYIAWAVASFPANKMREWGLMFGSDNWGLIIRNVDTLAAPPSAEDLMSAMATLTGERA